MCHLICQWYVSDTIASYENMAFFRKHFFWDHFETPLVYHRGKTPRAVKVDVVFRPDKAEPYESLSLGKKVMERRGTLDKTWKKPWKNNIEKKNVKNIGRSSGIYDLEMIWSSQTVHFLPTKRSGDSTLRREMLIIYGDGVETYVTLRGRAEKRCCIGSLGHDLMTAGSKVRNVVNHGKPKAINMVNYYLQ